MEINKDAYNAYVKEVTPVNPVWKNIVRAFVTGGIICTIGQAVRNWLMSYGMDEKTAAAWNLLVLILGSIVLTGFNLYPKIVKWGAIDHAAEDVPPVEVRAEGMLGTGRDEAGRRGHLQRVVRGEDSGKQGDDDHQKYDQPAGNKCHPGHPQRQPALLGVIGSLFHTAASLVECNPGVQEGIE